ncbi:PREDICTED: pleckstrin homology domain-containing family G member 4B-like [Priapulus caudatus]|uniref:Pleckstrin homology domain-containing family G member 4B-like n=1 Tax=Priapulus caudatus TaxID=37621 RepID=A0ABM1DUB9_PRICU|nr:PREDICTED: pleckstrin homology domain-containing family G member 4B-like [Priapulus caudatus]
MCCSHAELGGCADAETTARKDTTTTSVAPRRKTKSLSSFSAGETPTLPLPRCASHSAKRAAKSAGSKGSSADSPPPGSPKAVEESSKELEEKIKSYRKAEPEFPTEINKIDMECLKTKLAILTGHRDVDGHGVIMFDTAKVTKACTVENVGKILLYYSTIAREEIVCKGFTVLVDVRGATPASAELITAVLYNLQANLPGAVNKILVLAANINDAAATILLNSSFKCLLLKSCEALIPYIDEDQLPTQTGGKYAYNHDDWIKYRMKIEPFIDQCRAAANHLLSLMQELKGARLPTTAQGTSEVIDRHKHYISCTFDDPELTSLQTEGDRIMAELQRVERLTALELTPDYRDTVERVGVLYKEVQKVMLKLAKAAENRIHKLENCLQMKTFEEESNNLLSWLRTVAAAELTQHQAVTDNLRDSRNQERNFDKFYFTAMENIAKGADLVEEAGIVTDGSQEMGVCVRELSKTLKREMKGFSARLEDTREVIENTAQCYKLLDKAYEWALQAMKYISTMKMELHSASAEGLAKLSDSLKVCIFLHVVGYWFLITSPGGEYGRIRRRDDEPLATAGPANEQPSAAPAARSPRGRARAGHDPPRHRSSIAGRPPSGQQAAAQQPAESGIAKATKASWALHREGGASDADELLGPLQARARDAALFDEACRRSSFVARAAASRSITCTLLTGDARSSLPEGASGPASAGEQVWDGPPRINSDNKEEHISHSISDFRLSEDEAKSRRTLQLIMSEMYQTEQDYVNSLGYIIDHYFPEMEREDLPQELRGKRNVVFGNIEKIYEFHSQYFLGALDQFRDAPFHVGQIFLRYENQFYLYSLYNKNKPKSDELLAEIGSNFFRTKQLQLGDKMDLASYLLKPVQRMGKYALLLKQILQECPVTDPYHQELRAAEEMVKFQLRHGNDLLAMDALREADVSVQEQGQLLRQEEFLILQGRRKCLRHIFLFEDLILFSKTKHNVSKGGHETYQYKHSIKMTDVGLTEQMGDSPTKFEIWFRRRTSRDTYIIQAATPEIRLAWVKEISKLLWKQALRSRSIRLHEMTSMGVGSRPMMDLKTSSHQINDRTINPPVCQQLNINASRFRNSIAVSSFEHLQLQQNKRPHSVISISSSSSSNSSQSAQSFLSYGAAGPLIDVNDSPHSRHRPASMHSAESGICADISTIESVSDVSEITEISKTHRTDSAGESLAPAVVV